MRLGIALASPLGTAVETMSAVTCRQLSGGPSLAVRMVLRSVYPLR